MKSILMAAIAALFFASLASPAEAMSKYQNDKCIWDNNGRTICMGSSMTIRQSKYTRRHVNRKRQRIAAYDGNGNGTTILPHPVGCPSRAFCACGASVRIFGHSIRSLWPSTAWYRFPRDAAAAGNVAVRRGHVFVLESHVSGRNWLVSDYNSGGHKSRRHVRSIAGYTIVNPHGQHSAMLTARSRL